MTLQPTSHCGKGRSGGAETPPLHRVTGKARTARNCAERDQLRPRCSRATGWKYARWSSGRLAASHLRSPKTFTVQLDHLLSSVLPAKHIRDHPRRPFLVISPQLLPGLLIEVDYARPEQERSPIPWRWDVSTGDTVQRCGRRMAASGKSDG